MSFSIHNLNLVQEVHAAMAVVWRKYYERDIPFELYHYTKDCETVCKIINNRCLWAKSLPDQKDQLELAQGIGWIENELARRISFGVSPFVERVLREVPQYLESRKSLIFITCFCGDGDSSFHWNEYGGFRLTRSFPNAPQNFLTSAAWESETWYQPVIYDHNVQQEVVYLGIDAVIHALERNTMGIPDGPWIISMATDCARDTGMMLLKLIVGFKNESFAPEKEWRLVSCPKMKPAYSDPSMPDQSFSFAIKSSPRRLELQLQSRVELFAPLTRPGIPFSGIKQNPDAYNPAAQARLRKLLVDNGRPDISCL